MCTPDTHVVFAAEVVELPAAVVELSALLDEKNLLLRLGAAFVKPRLRPRRRRVVLRMFNYLCGDFELVGERSDRNGEALAYNLCGLLAMIGRVRELLASVVILGSSMPCHNDLKFYGFKNCLVDNWNKTKKKQIFVQSDLTFYRTRNSGLYRWEFGVVFWRSGNLFGTEKVSRQPQLRVNLAKCPPRREILAWYFRLGLKDVQSHS
jgi:hypothetical protein